MIIIALTPKGVDLSLFISQKVPDSLVYLPKKFDDIIQNNPKVFFFDDIDKIIAHSFNYKKPLLFIMATGIVVRKICPYLCSKDRDPPVVVMDENGRYVISLISGHLGGANRLARQIANITGGEAVITTATDVNNLPAIDVISKENDLIIEDTKKIKKINYALISKKEINVIDPHGIIGNLGDFFIKTHFKNALIQRDKPTVYISEYGKSEEIPRDWLILRPKNLVIGLGCNSGTLMDEISLFIQEVFQRFNLSIFSIKKIASIEKKKDEKGIIDTAKYYGVNIEWYPSERLSRINVPNPSIIVMTEMGTPSVAEAAAMIASKNMRLLIPKQKKGNVTLAVAREKYQ